MLKEIIAFVISSLYVSTCSAVCVTQPLNVGEITRAENILIFKEIIQ
jgi:hypothetical protein